MGTGTGDWGSGNEGCGSQSERKTSRGASKQQSLVPGPRSLIPCFLLFLAAGFGHVAEQVNHPLGVTPFIIVPGNQFEEAFFPGQVVLQSGKAVVDRRIGVVDDIGGNNLVFLEFKDPLQVCF